MYAQQYPPSQMQTAETPETDRDPRESGNMIARLQVASELVAQLRQRLSNLNDRMFESNSTKGEGKAIPQHMSLLRFPDDIIADARCAESQINRIEGALGL